MAVGIESEEISEGLDSNDGTRDGIVFRNCILDKNLQGFPGVAAEIGKKLPIAEKERRRIFGMLKTKCR